MIKTIRKQNRCYCIYNDIVYRTASQAFYLIITQLIKPDGNAGNY